MIKKLTALFLLMVIMLSTVTGCAEKHKANKKLAAEIAEEFSRFFDGNDVLAVFENTEKLRLEGRAINLLEVIPDEVFLGHLNIHDGNCYFATSSEKEDGTQAIKIYKTYSDFEEFELIFTKDGFLDDVDVHYMSSNDTFYIRARSNKVTVPSTYYEYNLVTGEYSLIGAMEYDKFNAWAKKAAKDKNEDQERYTVEKIKGGFLNMQNVGFKVTDLNGDERVIDADYLKGTEYIELLEKYGYYPMHHFVFGDRIFFDYLLDEPTRPPSPFNEDNSHVFFEYDFETNELTYCMYAYLQHQIRNSTKVVFLNN